MDNTYNLSGLKKICLAIIIAILSILFEFTSYFVKIPESAYMAIQVIVAISMLVLVVTGLKGVEKYSSSFTKAMYFVLAYILAIIAAVIVFLIFGTSAMTNYSKVKFIALPFIIAAASLIFQIIVLLTVKNIVSGCVAIAGQNGDGIFGRNFVAIWVRFFAFFGLEMIFGTIFTVTTLRNVFSEKIQYSNGIDGEFIKAAFYQNPVFGGAAALTGVFAIILCLVMITRIKATYDKFNGNTVPEGIENIR